MLLKTCQFSPEIRDHCRRIAAAHYYWFNLDDSGRREALESYQRSLITELYTLLPSGVCLTDLLTEPVGLNGDAISRFLNYADRRQDPGFGYIID